MEPQLSSRRSTAALWFILGAMLLTLGVGVLLHLSGTSSDVAMVLPPLATLTAWFLIARRPWRALGFARRPGAAGIAWGLLAYLVAAVFASAELVLRDDAAGSLDLGIDRLLQALLMVVLVAGIATGLTEEVMFRGALLGLLRERCTAVWAVAITSVLFSLLHVPNMLGREPSLWEGLINLGGYVVFGATMAYLVVRTGSLWMAIGWHAGGNAAWVALAALSTGEASARTTPAAMVAMAVEVVVVIALAESFRRSSRGAMEAATH